MRKAKVNPVCIEVFTLNKNCLFVTSL